MDKNSPRKFSTMLGFWVGFFISIRLGEHKIPAYVPNVQSYSVD